MVRPKRNTAEASGSGEFDDPLKNYDGPEYTDELERHLLEDTVADLQTTPVETIDASATVRDAINVMNERNIASLLVMEGGELVGIFSERDVLKDVADRFNEIAGHPLRDYMTSDLETVNETDSPAKALNLMATGGFRHVPIVDVDGKMVGILGPRRITRYLTRHVPARR